MIQKNQLPFNIYYLVSHSQQYWNFFHPVALHPLCWTPFIPHNNISDSCFFHLKSYKWCAWTLGSTHTDIRQHPHWPVSGSVFILIKSRKKIFNSDKSSTTQEQQRLDAQSPAFSILSCRKHPFHTLGMCRLLFEYLITRRTTTEKAARQRKTRKERAWVCQSYTSRVDRGLRGDSALVLKRAGCSTNESTECSFVCLQKPKDRLNVVARTEFRLQRASEFPLFFAL